MIILIISLITLYVLFGIMNAIVASMSIVEDTAFTYTQFEKWLCLVVAFLIWPVSIIMNIVVNVKEKHGKR